MARGVPRFLPCICSGEGCRRTWPFTKATLKPTSTVSQSAGSDRSAGGAGQSPTRSYPYLQSCPQLCLLPRYQAAWCLLSGLMTVDCQKPEAATGRAFQRAPSPWARDIAVPGNLAAQGSSVWWETLAKVVKSRLRAGTRVNRHQRGDWMRGEPPVACDMTCQEQE